MDKSNYIFLLGGSDLEMVEIKRILKRKKETFIDRNLTWKAASWKSFQDIFELQENEGKTFVGIELQDKEFQPQNAIDIDHHGEMEGNPSALEQVIDLLEIPDSFTKRRKLIAANDTGYIPAMQKLGASKEEIEKIRQLDRKAQGVTEADETLAEEAIRRNSETRGDLTIIRAFNGKFSPITDRLHGKVKELLIYSDLELSYYGVRRNKVASLFQKELDNDRAYLGGEVDGYFGLKEGKWTEEEIVSVKDRIIQELCNEKIHSHHIFLFPFKWGKPKEKNLFDLNIFDKLKEGNWESNLFDLKGLDRFNEYNYFYEHVREMLYQTDKSLLDNQPQNQFMRHFEYKVKKDSNYHIRIGNKTYSLAIDSIILNVYKMGTAVLSFHLRNHSYYEPTEILDINKFGRRISVPYFDLKPESIYSGEPDESYKDEDHDQLKGTRYEIPDSIWIGDSEKDERDTLIREDFTHYLDIKKFEKNPFILPGFIRHLFPVDFISDQNTKGEIELSLVLDDRMHVISWFGNTKQVSELTKIKRDFNKNRKTNEPFYSYESAEWWQNYVFVDTCVMQTNRFIRQAQLESKTYSRFVEWNTLFGVSRYSFVMLTKDFHNLEKGNVTFVVRHLQSIYYKMVELCLLQRATILRFSEEIAQLSQRVFDSSEQTEKDDDTTEIARDITNLYRRYIFFINRIYFREITPQEQGIELYDMLQKNMRLPQEVKNLDEEIRELNAFVEMQNNRRSADEQEKLAKEGHRLTRIATLFLVPTLIAGIAGMNTLPPPTWKITCVPYWPFWINLIVVLLPSLTLLVFWNYRTKSKKAKK